MIFESLENTCRYGADAGDAHAMETRINRIKPSRIFAGDIRLIIKRQTHFCAVMRRSQ